MTIIFLAGTTSKDVKAAYIAALAERIPNSIYLDLNNISKVFSQPATSEFIGIYTYEQRILRPGHEAVLGIAQDNIPLGKVALLDGDFDFDLMADCVMKKFPALQSEMIAIYLQTENDVAPAAESLSRLVQSRILTIDSTVTIESNLTAILRFVDISPAEKNREPGMLIMVAGVAGTAKSTHLRKTCAQISDSVYIDKDTVAVRFLDIVNEGMPSLYYNTHVKSQSYEVIFAFAADNLKLNKTTLLDGCFGDRLTGALISNYLATSNYLTSIMYFHCSGPTQRINILDRNVQRDTEKLKNLPEDRRSNLQKHLKDFSQIDPAATVLYVDTEHREDTHANVKKILAYLLQSSLISLKMNVRIIPYDEKSCAITTEEAQGGLSEFLALLARTIANDQRRQNDALIRHIYKKSSLVTSRNSIWRVDPTSMADYTGLKLPSGNNHQWPDNGSHQDLPANYRHRR